MAFKDNLRATREEKGWTQAQAAKAAGVALRSYQNWEIGGREPRLDALVSLAEAFNVTVDSLLRNHKPPKSPKKK